MAEAVSAIRSDRVVLRGVSFSLAPGEALMVMGANGAGKSTLLRILAGLREPDAGSVRWRGDDIRANWLEHAGRVAYLGHRDALKPGLTVAENLYLFPRAAPKAEHNRALAALDLLPLADMPVRMLSAGQSRRVALARIASSTAPLWLLDEPGTGLDDTAIDRMGALLARHRAGGGMVIAATHTPLPLPNAITLPLS